MWEDLPSLHALHCFDVAARAGTFSAAAREMHLTHGAISRQIHALETALHTRVFDRGSRQLLLTESGRQLRATTEGAFALLREGIGALQRERGGPVVLSCEPTLTLEWLIPRLGRMQALHPSLKVHVEASGGPIDFAGRQAGHVDVAVRRRDFAIPAGVTCEPLMDEWLGPVCSPAIARAVREKKQVTLLHTRTRLSAFTDWSRATSRRLSSRRRLDFDHFSHSLQAAVAGLGVAIGPYPLVADALRARRLVAPFGFVRGEVGYVTLRPDARVDDERVSTLVRWLARQAVRMRPAEALRDATVSRSMPASKRRARA